MATTAATTRISFFFQITSRSYNLGRANALAHVMSSSRLTHCTAGSNRTLKCNREHSDDNDDNGDDKNSLLFQITSRSYFGRANALAHIMSSSRSTRCMAGSNGTLKCK